MTNIIFVKPVEFMFIEKGDIFKVYYDYDEKPHIILKGGKKLYLNKRNELGYFKELEQTLGDLK